MPRPFLACSPTPATPAVSTTPIPSIRINQTSGRFPRASTIFCPPRCKAAPPTVLIPSAWGRFRVILHPTALAYQHRVVLGRGGGFYLHEDANHNGTAGCIGLLNTRDNRVLLERIQNATSSRPSDRALQLGPGTERKIARRRTAPSAPPPPLHRAGIDPPASPPPPRTSPKWKAPGRPPPLPWTQTAVRFT